VQHEVQRPLKPRASARGCSAEYGESADPEYDRVQKNLTQCRDPILASRRPAAGRGPLAAGGSPRFEARGLRNPRPSTTLTTMSVYLFTFHAYRSWNADNPRGFVQQGKGIQAPNVKLARYYDQRAEQPPVLFEQFHQRVLIWTAFDVCDRRGWRLHFVATEPTHVHILVSWRSPQPWGDVRKRLKNVASLTLGRKLQQPGRKWFSRKGSRKRVRNRAHFDHLVNQYLPKHGGLRWREREPPPIEPPANPPP